jgi:hypothetical protein
MTDISLEREIKDILMSYVGGLGSSSVLNEIRVRIKTALKKYDRTDLDLDVRLLNDGTIEVFEVGE